MKYSVVVSALSIGGLVLGSFHPDDYLSLSTRDINNILEARDMDDFYSKILPRGTMASPSPPKSRESSPSSRSPSGSPLQRATGKFGSGDSSESNGSSGNSGSSGSRSRRAAFKIAQADGEQPSPSPPKGRAAFDGSRSPEFGPQHAFALHRAHSQREILSPGGRNAGIQQAQTLHETNGHASGSPPPPASED